MGSAHDSGVMPALTSQFDAENKIIRFPLGTEPPRALLGAARVDHSDATTWVPPHHSQILTPPASPSESDERAIRTELVRADLARTAVAYGLNCVARVALTARTEVEWEDVARGFEREDLPGMFRYDVRAAGDAAERMAARDVEGAIAALAEVDGWSVEEWIADAQKGGAR